MCRVSGVLGCRRKRGEEAVRWRADGRKVEESISLKVEKKEPDGWRVVTVSRAPVYRYNYGKSGVEAELRCALRSRAEPGTENIGSFLLGWPLGIGT